MVPNRENYSLPIIRKTGTRYHVAQENERAAYLFPMRPEKQQLLPENQIIAVFIVFIALFFESTICSCEG
jgi:hypothetical protein